MGNPEPQYCRTAKGSGPRPVCCLRARNIGGLPCSKRSRVRASALLGSCVQWEAAPKQRNIGVYLGQMEKHGFCEPKELGTLKQIKDLHRNALIDPEETLTVEDAIGLLGIVRNAISAMLAPLPDCPRRSSQPLRPFPLRRQRLPRDGPGRQLNRLLNWRLLPYSGRPRTS
jgi:hypothetical protein